MLFAQGAAASPPGLDWQQLAAVYGPLIGVLGVVLKLHWDMLHKTIPAALESIRGELRKNRTMVRHLMEELAEMQPCRSAARSARKPEEKPLPSKRSRRRSKPDSHS